MNDTTNENSTVETDTYELPEEQVNKAFIDFAVKDDEGSLRVHGDSFVSQRIPALLTYTASKMAGQVDDEALLKTLAEYEGKPWGLVVECAPGTGDSEDGEPEDTWTISRAEDDEDQTILGPILTLLAYLIENEDVAGDLQQAGADK